MPTINMPKKNAVKKSKGNCYRDLTNYSLCYEVLYSMGRAKPVSRNTLIQRVSKLSGLDTKRVGYNYNIILSPDINGNSHRSARNADYYVERLADGMVRLVLR